MSYKYNAFISYRHAENDLEIAEHIQNALEQFHIPGSVRKERDLKGNLRIFRDKNDLPVTDSLNDTIGTALRESEYLIVICSTHTKESVWVEKEIELFLRTHSRKNILTVLVDGEPFNVIPPSLLFEEKEEINESGETILVRYDLEPLSADYRGGIKKAKKTELPRLAAGLIGCSYEELLHRRQQYRNRVIAAASLCLLSLIAIAGTYVIRTSMKIQENYQQALYNQSEYLSGESIRVKSEENNRELATQLSLPAVPDDDNDMPYNPHAQLALFNAVDPYSIHDKDEFIGIRSYEAEQDETLFNVEYMEEKGYLAGLDYNHLYLWDTNTGELINKDSFHTGYVDGILCFSDSYLWAVSYREVKMYPLDEPSNGRLLDTGSRNRSQESVFSDNYLYLLATIDDNSEEADEEKYNWYLYVIDLETAEIKTKMSLKERIPEETEIKDIEISPDDKYCCIAVNSSEKEKAGGYSYKESDELVVIDLINGKSYKKKIFKDSETNRYIDDMCFYQHKLVLSSYTIPVESKESIQDLNRGIYLYNDHRMLCYDIAEDSYAWSLEGFGNKGDGPAQIQYLYLKNENTDKYQKVIVSVFSNHVMIISAKDGNILQEEYMPCDSLALMRSPDNKKSDSIGLYMQTEQKFLKLFYDDNDSEIHIEYVLTISQPGLRDFWLNLSESDDMFVCYSDEIRQFKKGISNEDSEWIDMKESDNSIWKQISFDNYLVILTTSTIDLYDLKEKCLLDSQPFDAGSGTIIGAVDDKVIIRDDPETSGVFYSYDVKKKSIKKIELSLKDSKNKMNDIVGATIRDDSLVVLFETTIYNYEADTNKSILHSAVCDLSGDKDFIIDEGVQIEFDIFDLYPDEDGKYAYINSSSDGKIECVDMESGLLKKSNSSFSRDKKFFWHDNYLILYNKNRIVVIDVLKMSEILSIENDDIISCGMNDDMLYYISMDGRIHRISLKDKKEKIVLLNKYNDYLNIKLLENNNSGLAAESWFFEDQVIRIVTGSTALEVDKSTLELIGYCEDVLCYSQDMNCYCIQEYGGNRIGLLKCYSLKDLIKMGKKIVDGRDMSKKNKMKYGLE